MAAREGKLCSLCEQKAAGVAITHTTVKMLDIIQSADENSSLGGDESSLAAQRVNDNLAQALLDLKSSEDIRIQLTFELQEANRCKLSLDFLVNDLRCDLEQSKEALLIARNALLDVDSCFMDHEEVDEDEDDCQRRLYNTLPSQSNSEFPSAKFNRTICAEDSLPQARPSELYFTTSSSKPLDSVPPEKGQGQLTSME
jgi:hypothetical protein